MKKRNKVREWIAPWSFLGRQGFNLPLADFFLENPNEKISSGRRGSRRLMRSRFGNASHNAAIHRGRRLAKMKAPEILKLEDGTEAERLDEIGGCGETDVIYLDRAGNFYHWHSKQRELPEGVKLTLPDELEKYHRLTHISHFVRKFSERQALALFVELWGNGGPLKSLLKECVAGFVPRAERRGKARLETWVPRSLAKSLKAFARSQGREPDAQLELFAREGLSRPKAERRKRSVKAADRPPFVQLELATALVACCARLTCEPSTETLAEARRNVSILHRDLHADETFKAVANG